MKPQHVLVYYHHMRVLIKCTTVKQTALLNLQPQPQKIVIQHDDFIYVISNMWIVLKSSNGYIVNAKIDTIELAATLILYRVLIEMYCIFLNSGVGQRKRKGEGIVTRVPPFTHAVHYQA